MFQERHKLNLLVKLDHYFNVSIGKICGFILKRSEVKSSKCKISCGICDVLTLNDSYL